MIGELPRGEGRCPPHCSESWHPSVGSDGVKIVSRGSVRQCRSASLKQMPAPSGGRWQTAGAGRGHRRRGRGCEPEEEQASPHRTITYEKVTDILGSIRISQRPKVRGGTVCCGLLSVRSRSCSVLFGRGKRYGGASAEGKQEAWAASLESKHRYSIPHNLC